MPTIHLTDLSDYQRRFNNLPTIPTTKSHKKRGEGAWAKRKAKRTERLPRILQVLGMKRLPDAFRVCAYPANMNGWEKKYAEHLMKLKAIGEVLDFEFEPVEIELAPGCRYAPDFLVNCRNASTVKFVEIKGRSRIGPARIDIFKIARHKFHEYSWEILELKDGGWIERKVYYGFPENK